MWWSLAILSALASLGRNIIMRDLGTKMDEFSNVLGRFIFILPFAFVLSAFYGFPRASWPFWICSILGGFFVAVSTMFLSKAFKYSHISLTVALWKINIIFLFLLEALILKANFSSFGILGILLTVVGMYLLNIKKAHVSLLKPFSLLFEDKGMRYALLSAVTLAPSMFMFKICVNLSDPYFPALTLYCFATLFTLPVVIKMSLKHFISYTKHWKSLVLMGFFAFLSTVLATIGYKESYATYVESVKQSEVLFALIVGFIFFKEKDRVKEIWLGCCVIIVGITLVIFGS